MRWTWRQARYGPMSIMRMRAFRGTRGSSSFTDRHDRKIRHALQYDRRSTPGRPRSTTRTDTYILGTVITRLLREQRVAVTQTCSTILIRSALGVAWA